MTIKQQGGVFGRNPSFNEVTVGNDIAKLTQNGGNAYLDTERFQIRAPDGSLVGLQYNPGDNGRVQLRYSGVTKLQTTGTGVSVTGNVAVSDGGGIDFSATSGTGTSELFDDYEEGTFTPVVADAATGGNTGTASAAHGHYTKIGNQVTIHLNMTNIDTTGLTAGNDLYIQGLPYSSAAVAGTITYNGNMWGSLIDLNATTPYLVPSVSENQSAILFREWGDNTGTDNLIVSELTSGSSDLNISLSYFAA